MGGGSKKGVRCAPPPTHTHPHTTHTTHTHTLSHIHTQTHTHTHNGETCIIHQFHEKWGSPVYGTQVQTISNQIFASQKCRCTKPRENFRQLDFNQTTLNQQTMDIVHKGVPAPAPPFLRHPPLDLACLPPSFFKIFCFPSLLFCSTPF